MNLKSPSTARAEPQRAWLLPLLLFGIFAALFHGSFSANLVLFAKFYAPIALLLWAYLALADRGVASKPEDPMAKA